MLSLFTEGLWIFIWILVGVSCHDSTTDPACTICGSTKTQQQLNQQQTARHVRESVFITVAIVVVILAVFGITFMCQVH
jgi:hypothetical protein